MKIDIQLKKYVYISNHRYRTAGMVGVAMALQNLLRFEVAFLNLSIIVHKVYITLLKILIFKI